MDAYSQIDCLKNMQRIRYFEKSYMETSKGEEAIAAGVFSLLRPQDHVGTANHEYIPALLKGVNAKIIWSEMYNGNHSSGSALKLYMAEKKFFEGSGALVSGLAQTLKLAFLSKESNEDRHTVYFFQANNIDEDGLNESLRLACLWNVPILFCCENDYYGLNSVYPVENNIVDGMNIFEVVEKTQKAFEYITKEKKPYLLDFQINRTKCPIDYLKSKMLMNGNLSPLQWSKIQDDIKEEFA
jgi:TPP-dependent pyruvate/acetoin dehydrogenase alpha subunit